MTPPVPEPASTGRTKGAGWQIGVSRTVGVPVQEVWAFLVSTEGLAFWLGQGVQVLDGRGQRYETTDGTAGEVRSLRPRDRVRLTWRPQGWDHDSTVQVAVTTAGPGRSVLRFHQERLADAVEREQQRQHWRAVLDAVVNELEPPRLT
ncbi:SRPBCC domain-containing protein [Pseudokineococcus sp. 1T1Z-3]|uniref:SRPBCC domain-containing protein n=1 Tax=Pseudokineococcus sp. 1T1Z-3 TaxID=3132745 RepID=UPI0030AE5BF0